MPMTLCSDFQGARRCGRQGELLAVAVRRRAEQDDRDADRIFERAVVLQQNVDLVTPAGDRRRGEEHGVRTGRDRFVRNVLIAIGNSGDASLAVEAERLLDDASPLVRGAAVWALSRLLPRETFAALENKKTEDDATVNDEWSAALR